jgi:hypothetical protein
MLRSMPGAGRIGNAILDTILLAIEAGPHTRPHFGST